MLPEFQFCAFNKVWTGNINMVYYLVDTYLCFLCTHSSFLSHVQAVNILCSLALRWFFAAFCGFSFLKRNFKWERKSFEEKRKREDEGAWHRILQINLGLTFVSAITLRMALLAYQHRAANMSRFWLAGQAHLRCSLVQQMIKCEQLPPLAQQLTCFHPFRVLGWSLSAGEASS